MSPFRPARTACGPGGRSSCTPARTAPGRRPVGHLSRPEVVGHRARRRRPGHGRGGVADPVARLSGTDRAYGVHSRRIRPWDARTTWRSAPASAAGSASALGHAGSEPIDAARRRSRRRRRGRASQIRRRAATRRRRGGAAPSPSRSRADRPARPRPRTRTPSSPPERRPPRAGSSSPGGPGTRPPPSLRFCAIHPESAGTSTV